jgi:signal peptidase
VLRVVAALLLVAVVVPFVVTGVPAVVGAEESFVVLSGSMNAEPEPVIRPGDVVIVDGVDPATVESGDIITYATGAENPITHRVIEVVEREGSVAYRTQGDANEDVDPQPVQPDQLVGTVIFVIPIIGHVVNFANTTQGFILLVLVPIGLLVLSEAWNLAGSNGARGDRDDDTSDSGATRSAGVGSPSASDEEFTSGDERSETAGGSTVTLSREQLRWAALGLLPVTVATGYAAFRLQSALAITLFYASAGLLAITGLLYVRLSGEAASRSAAGNGTAAGDTGSLPGTAERGEPVVTGRLRPSLDTGPRAEVVVESREELLEMARETGTWVVHDPDDGSYYLVTSEVLYRYDPPLTADAGADAALGTDRPDGWPSGTIRSVSRGNPNDGDPETIRDERSATDGGSLGLSSPDTHSGLRWEELTSSLAEPSESTVSTAFEGTVASAEPARDGEPRSTPPGSPGPGEVASESTPVADAPEVPSTEPSPAGGAGHSSDLAPSVRFVGWLLEFPIRGLTLVGYVLIAPSRALYRAVKGVSDSKATPEPGSDSTGDRSDERVERDI